MGIRRWHKQKKIRRQLMKDLMNNIGTLCIIIYRAIKHSTLVEFIKLFWSKISPWFIESSVYFIILYCFVFYISLMLFIVKVLSFSIFSIISIPAIIVLLYCIYLLFKQIRLLFKWFCSLWKDAKENIKKGKK